MKMPKPKKKSKSSKGSDFERAICKQLGLWWTNGERDDVFWRTSQSGGRATQRTKQGVATRNEYGDIHATDIGGYPLTNLATIEVKKGYTRQTIFDMLDKLPRETKQPYKLFLRQAIEQHYEAGSFSWWLISKRDYKNTMLTIPLNLKKLISKNITKWLYPSMYLRCKIFEDEPPYNLYTLPLDIFLTNVPATEIQRISKEVCS